jgi:nucleoside-diphosphate kinase
MTVERTLVLVKPDGVQRGLVGEVVARFERRGLKLVGMKLMRVDEGLAGRHYAEHREKPFFPGLVGFIISSPVVAMVWEGPGVVSMVRAMMGPTNPASAPPGTIRGDLAVDLGMNVIHGSDSPERGREEIALFFDPSEIVDWEPSGARWVVEAVG